MTRSSDLERKKKENFNAIAWFIMFMFQYCICVLGTKCQNTIHFLGGGGGGGGGGAGEGGAQVNFCNGPIRFSWG